MRHPQNPLITVAELRALRPGENERLRAVDCRFALADPDAGRRAFQTAHIPGALYLALEHDLAAPRAPNSGRHPLPAWSRFVARLAALGIGDGDTVVAYDDAGGAFAARLWWLLALAGSHPACRVLDGGWPAWLAAGGAQEQTARVYTPARLALDYDAATVVTTGELTATLGAPNTPPLVDAREPARYRGDHEPIDPVAGHIPGALNYFYRNNLTAELNFLPPDGLRTAWDAVIPPGAEPIHYCGSGVTACHNILARTVAGLPPGRLYAGSFSEWVAAPERPVAKGD